MAYARYVAVAAIVSRPELTALRAKYAEMLEMRLAEPEQAVAAAVRARMVALALQFPGALREIDGLELHELRRRLAGVGAALHRAQEVEPWIRATVLFHRSARGALCAKRWLAGRKQVGPEDVRAFAAAVPSMSFPHDAFDWALDLERVASPPRGRLTELVLQRVSRALSLSEREVRRLIFGPPRRTGPGGHAA